jgi:2-methylcitrate dehydratase PrpD
MGTTRTLAQLCTEIDFSGLSHEVVDRVAYLCVDFFGVAIRGAATESARCVQRAMAEVYDSSPKDMPVVGTDMQLNPSAAALTVGTAAHSIELDDVVNEASLHPGVAVFPAVLSAAWMSGKNGQELTAAVVAGYEVMIRLGKAVDPKAHYAQGFHPTGTCGTFGAAVAAAKLMDLDSEGICNALGIAGSQASGSMEFLTAGAYTKRLHAGWAAMSGLTAALLAKQGFTGPDTILEGRLGFLHSYTTNPAPEVILNDWGTRFEVLNTSIKPYACCRYKQSAIDGILYLRNKHGLSAQDIEEIQIGVLEAGFSLIADPIEAKQNPKSIVDAQFSMPFGAAVAIVKGRASLSEYTEENLQDKDIKQVMRKVHCVRDKALETEFPRKWPASVTIRTKDNEQYQTWVDVPKGDPGNPLSWDELIEKFNDLTADSYPAEQRDQIVSHIKALKEISGMKTLLNSFSNRSSP